MRNKKHTASKAVLITGASSGIGRALALEMARSGYRLALTARRYNLLEELRDEIAREDDERKRATPITLRSLDVRDYEDVLRAIPELAEELNGLDIVIANAGVGHRGQVGTGHFAEARETIDINLTGAMATVDAAATLFREQGYGHIVGVSSIAGFRGLPGSAAYSASKAGLSIYLEGVRAELRRYNVDITLLHPGFIATPINESLRRRPFLVDAETAAREIVSLVERRVKASSVPRMPWSIVGRIFKLLPRAVIARLQ